MGVKENRIVIDIYYSNWTLRHLVSKCKLSVRTEFQYLGPSYKCVNVFAKKGSFVAKKGRHWFYELWKRGLHTSTETAVSDKMFALTLYNNGGFAVFINPFQGDATFEERILRQNHFISSYTADISLVKCGGKKSSLKFYCISNFNKQ